MGTPSRASSSSRFGDTRPTWDRGVHARRRGGADLDALAALPFASGHADGDRPRHPQRFEAIANLLRERAVPFVRRSDNTAVTADIAWCSAIRSARWGRISRLPTSRSSAAVSFRWAGKT
jgi:hypothetical protein